MIDIETTPSYSFIGLYYPQEKKFNAVLYNRKNAESVLASLVEYDVILFFNIKFDLPHLIISSLTGLHPHDISHMIIGDRKVFEEVMRYKINREDTEFLMNALYKQEKLAQKYVDVQPLASIETVLESGMTALHKSSLKYFSAVFLGKIIDECTNLFDKKELTEEEKEQLREYNKKDLKNTYEIFMKVQKVYLAQKEMGKQFGINCCVKTNSALTIPLLRKMLGTSYLPAVVRIKNGYYDDRYKKEPILAPYLEIYDKIERREFGGNTAVTVPFLYKMPITLGEGGLHAISYELLYPNSLLEGEILVDFDVVSQYPSIYTQLDGIFHPTIQKVLGEMMNERKRLKKEGGCKATIAAYKLVLNGAYGKTGLEYDNNHLYNPIGMKRVAIGGQLQILYTVLRLSKMGYNVVYVNTDGFSILMEEKGLDIEGVKKIVTELVNKFYTDIEIEVNIYKKAAFFNVNSYGMVHMNGEVKCKKDFRETTLLSSPLYIAKELKRICLGVEYGELTIQDFIFIKTSKNGIYDGNKIAIGYYS
ncbi:MAG: hypothetical protein ACRCX2_00030, partial [Paraclostridium sp.]